MRMRQEFRKEKWRQAAWDRHGGGGRRGRELVFLRMRCRFFLTTPRKEGGIILYADVEMGARGDEQISRVR